MNFMKKRVMLFIAMAMLCLGSFAGNPGVTFLLTNGEKVSFIFLAKPVVSVTSDGIKVSATESSDVSYLFSEVDRFYFEDDIVTGIEGVKTETKATPVFSCENGVVSVCGLAAAEQVSVYSINGNKVAGAKADQTGSTHVDINHVPAGVYVVSAGSGVSFKLLKK